MSTIAGALEIQLFAGLARIEKDMKDVQRIVGGSMQKIESAVAAAKTALAGLGVSLSAAAFATMVKGTIDAMDHLNDLSKSTSLSVESLSGLRIAAKQSGSDLDGMAQAITKLSVNIGKDSEKFKALGISARDPLEAFKQLADLFTQLENPEQRAAVMAAALGKSWAAAAPLLAEGGAKIGELVQKGMELSDVTTAMAKQADELNDKWVLLVGTGGAMMKIVGPLLPMLNALADDMLNIKDKSSGANSGVSLLAESLRAIVVLGGNVAFVLRGVGNEIGGIAAQSDLMFSAIVKFNTGRFAGALSDARAGIGLGTQMRADAEAARKEFDAWEKRMMNVGPQSRDVTAQNQRELNRLGAPGPSAANNAAAARAAAFLRTPAAGGGTDPAAAELKLFETEVRKLQSALSRLNEETESEKLAFALWGANIRMVDGSTVHLTGNLETLTAAHKKLLLVLAQQVDARQQEFAANAAALANAKEMIAEEDRRNSVTTAFNTSQSEVVKGIQFETEMLKIQAPLVQAGLLSTENALRLHSQVNLEMEKAAALRRIDIDLQNALLALGPEVNAGYEEAAQKLRDLAEAQKAALPDVLAQRSNLRLIQDLNRVAAEEIGDRWRKGAQAMESSMSNFFFSAMRGEFTNLGQSFKSMLDRMVADELAAMARMQLFGKNPGMGGGLIGGAMNYFNDGGSNGIGGDQGDVDWIGTALKVVGGFMGSFDTGTPYVPRTGLAMLHQGERVIPAAENRSGNADSGERRPPVSVTINQSFAGTVNRQTVAQAAIEAQRVIQHAARNA